MISLLLSLSLLSGGLDPSEPEAWTGPKLAEAGHGSVANYVDMNTIQRDGDNAKVKTLLVVDANFLVEGKGFLGGWYEWEMKCESRIADQRTFAAIHSDGHVGPRRWDQFPPFEAVPGGDAAEILDITCGTVVPTTFLTLDEAIAQGQAKLAE